MVPAAAKLNSYKKPVLVVESERRMKPLTDQYSVDVGALRRKQVQTWSDLQGAAWYIGRPGWHGDGLLRPAVPSAQSCFPWWPQLGQKSCGLGSQPILSFMR